MDTDSRFSTDFFERQGDVPYQQERNSTSETEEHVTFSPPAVNIVPPPIDTTEYEWERVNNQDSSVAPSSEAQKNETVSEERNANEKRPPFKNILRSRGRGDNNKAVPKLTLTTALPHDSDEGSSSRLIERSLSPLSRTRTRGRVRRQSVEDGSVSGEDSVDRSLISAKILSYVGGDDVSEFHDIQNDLQKGLSGEGLWLPQLDGKAIKPTSLKETEDALQNAENDASLVDRSTEFPERAFIRDHSNAKSLGRSQARKDEKENIDVTVSSQDGESTTELYPLDHLRRTRRLKGPLTLYGNSLGLVSPKNALRLKLAEMLLSKYYKYTFFLLLNVFIAILVCRSYNVAQTTFLYNFSGWSDYLIFVLSVCFSLNDLMKIIAFGFWDDSQMFAAYDKRYSSLIEQLGIVRFFNYAKTKYNFTMLDYLLPLKTTDEDRKKLLREREEGKITSRNISKDFDTPRAFMRSSWNRIDFTSSICFWIGLLISINDYDVKNGIRIFKALAVLRILRMLDTDTMFPSVFRSLKIAMPQLLNVGTILVYFWILFGILGVQSFRGSLRRRCVWYNPDDPSDTFINDSQFCGGYLDPLNLERQPYVFEDGSIGPNTKGFLCPQYSKCVSGENPYNGRTSFDNIISAMEMVFVVMSANTFTDIMSKTMNTDSMAASLFFIVATFVLTIWLMNLLIAVLVSSFELANEQYKKSSLLLDNRKKYSNIMTRLRKRAHHYIIRKTEQNEPPFWIKRCQKLYSGIEFLFVILITVDLILRCMVKSDGSRSSLEWFYTADFSISAALLFESFLRLFLSCTNIWCFIKRYDYVFDLVVSIATFVISGKQLFSTMGRAYYWLSFLQISRFYRVVFTFKVSSALWRRVLSNWRLIWDLSSFYFFFIFLVSIIMSISFEGVVPAQQLSEVGFGMFSFSNTFLSLFVVASTENWTNVLYALQQYSPSASSAFFASVFTIIWFILSNSVMMNIFIAVIAATMDVEEQDKRPLQIQHYLKYVYPRKIREYTEASLAERIQRTIFRKKVKHDTKDFKHFLMRGSAIMNMAQNSSELAEQLSKSKPTKKKPPKLLTYLLKLGKRFSFWRKMELNANNPFYKHAEVVFTEMEENDQNTIVLQLDDHEEEKLAYLRDHPSFNYSYFILSPHHLFRKFCQRLVPPSVGKRTDGVRFFEDDTNMYDNRIHFHLIERDIFLLLITCTTIALIIISCLSTPLYRMERNMKSWDWSTSWNCAMICIFSIEFVVKTVADGVVYSPNAYLRNPWNAIDLFVLISLWITFFAYLRNDGGLSRLCRGLSALRALRLLTVSNMARETFKLVVFDGVKKILEAAFVSMTLLFPFSVWGLALFRGRLGTCNDGDMNLDQCYGEFIQTVFQWDVLMPRTYGEPYLNLNSFSNTLRSLYEVVSLEGWTDLLQNLMSSTGIGTAASTFASPGNGVFLILFNFLSMVFILNLFVSFIISNHGKTTGTAYLTIEEKSWFEAKKLLSQAKPRRAPEMQHMSRFRRFFYSLAFEKKNFYYVCFLQFVLYIHIVMLLCRTFDKPNSKIVYEDVFFMFSSTVFLLQELFLLYGETFLIYFSSNWKILRFCIVVSCFVLTAVGFKVRNDALTFNNIKELFHLMIFLFIIPQNNTLSELLQTAAASWPSIFSLTYTWGILFLVYAIALNQIFGLTRLGPNTDNNINFRTVTKSLIVLFKCSFGEGWNYIMADLTVQEPFCFMSPDGGYDDCGSMTYAYFLLMSWNILSMYIFVNMFISVVMSNFSYVYRRGASKSPIDRKQILIFVDAWAKFDTNGRGKINPPDLPRLMHSFDGPLSFKIWEGTFTIRELVNNYMDVNPDDPYDVKVNLEGFNKHLDMIDTTRIIKRRLQYMRFVQQVRFTNNFQDAIHFGNLIQLIPLYTTYAPSDCMGIDEYVRNLYTIGKVDKYLKNGRNYDVLNMVVTAWKYRHRRTKSKKDGDDLIQPQQVSIMEPVKPAADFSVLNTPVMDYGVDNFMWSPRPGFRTKEQAQGATNEHPFADENEDPFADDDKDPFADENKDPFADENDNGN